jgi:hypothetical protein
MPPTFCSTRDKCPNRYSALWIRNDQCTHCGGQHSWSSATRSVHCGQFVGQVQSSLHSSPGHRELTSQAAGGWAALSATSSSHSKTSKLQVAEGAGIVLSCRCGCGQRGSCRALVGGYVDCVSPGVLGPDPRGRLNLSANWRALPLASCSTRVASSCSLRSGPMPPDFPL